MANQKLMSMTIGVPGIEIMIWYNDVNLRVGAVEWTLPEPGIVARVQIWDSNVDPDVPVIDRTLGQGNGAETIPGNYRLVEIEDPDLGNYLWLPENITFRFNIQTLG